jgi:hypothetical protein
LILPYNVKISQPAKIAGFDKTLDRSEEEADFDDDEDKRLEPAKIAGFHKTHQLI